MINLKLKFGEKKENKWTEYVIRKKAETESEYSNRLFGIKNSVGAGYIRAGYKNLRKFFDGDQWEFLPEDGSPPNVYNICATTVWMYTAFMTNEPVEFDVPSVDKRDEVENARAEAKEKVLYEVLKDNKFNTMFEETVAIGSELGDSFIIGPLVRDPENPRIIFNRVKRPENIRLIWKDDSYEEITGFIHTYYVAQEVAEEMFADKIESGKVNISPAQMSESDKETSVPMVEVVEYWDDIRFVQIINNRQIEYVEHNWGFIPIVYVKNIPDPNRPYGISDIENLLDTQKEFNEKTNNLARVIANEANPKLFGKNIEPQQINSGVMEVIDLGDEAEFLPDPRRSGVPPLSEMIRSIRNTGYELSGIPQVLSGGQTTTEFSGRALAVFMQPVNNRIKGRQTRWKTGLRYLCANIFRLIELYFPKYKELIGGVYDVDVYFPGTLLRNITDEINKFNAKLQSQYTTMKNLGVASPKDEQTVMKKELSDAQIAVEISRSPQLQMEITGAFQKIMQAKQQQQQAVGPQLQEGENQKGEQPTAMGGAPQQSALSAEGAIRQATQREGGAVPIKEE